MAEKITRVDPKEMTFLLHRDLSVTTRAHAPGPPKRIDGMTMGIITMSQNAPHNGELHPDGDEILYVISGGVQVRGESAPDKPLELHAGDACIIHKGEWHKVELLETTQLLHITPGPNGDHRPLRNAGPAHG